MNIRQIKAVEFKNKQKWINHFGSISDDSGIYILTRYENGFKYAYVGQAKHILTRLAQHLSGYQHIDLSIKKHGLYSDDNLTGWNLRWNNFTKSELDTKEQEYIKEMANLGYQMRNKTAGGQSVGKFEIAETKPKLGYRDGLKQGYLNASKEIANLFNKYLDFTIKGEKQTKIKEKAIIKFNKFLNGEE